MDYWHFNSSFILSLNYNLRKIEKERETSYSVESINFFSDNQPLFHISVPLAYQEDLNYKLINEHLTTSLINSAKNEKDTINKHTLTSTDTIITTIICNQSLCKLITSCNNKRNINRIYNEWLHYNCFQQLPTLRLKILRKLGNLHGMKSLK